LRCLTASDNFPFTIFRVSSGTSQFSEKGAAPVSLRSSMQWHLNFRTGASVNSMMLAPQRQEERVMISFSGWICRCGWDIWGLVREDLAGLWKIVDDNDQDLGNPPGFIEKGGDGPLGYDPTCPLFFERIIFQHLIITTRFSNSTLLHSPN
jgi:hypothetical protein